MSNILTTGKFPAPSSVTSQLKDKMDQWEALLPDVKSGDDQFKVFEDEGQDHVDVRYVPALNKVKLYIRSEAFSFRSLRRICRRDPPSLDSGRKRSFTGWTWKRNSAKNL